MASHLADSGGKVHPAAPAFATGTCWLRDPLNAVRDGEGRRSEKERRMEPAATATAGMSPLVAILVMIIIGAIAGWLAGIIVKGGGYGLVGDIVIGILGAVIGGWILRALGLTLGGGILGAIVVAVIGAVILLVIIRMIKRA